MLNKDQMSGQKMYLLSGQIFYQSTSFFQEIYFLFILLFYRYANAFAMAGKFGRVHALNAGNAIAKIARCSNK